MSRSVEMTRQQLWDLVWSMSIGKAAAHFPMSQAKLRNCASNTRCHCRRTGIGRRAPTGSNTKGCHFRRVLSEKRAFGCGDFSSGKRQTIECWRSKSGWKPARTLLGRRAININVRTERHR